MLSYFNEVVMKQKWLERIKSFLKREEEGATMVEYGLMVALIAVVCIAAVTALGLDVSAMFTSVDTSVKAAAS
jgi:pilus assembly protein Flp/PilA